MKICVIVGNVAMLGGFIQPGKADTFEIITCYFDTRSMDKNQELDFSK